MKRLIAAIALLSLLAACGDDVGIDSPSGPETNVGNNVTVDAWNDPSWSYHEVETPNGIVECIYADLGRGGGPTCNWSKFNGDNGDR